MDELEIKFRVESFSPDNSSIPIFCMRLTTEKGFIGLILASYVRSVHKQNEYLRTKFASIEDILAEMRSIRCIEHEGRLKFITPFVGAQVDFCRAFGFDIPDGCAPTYTSRKKSLTPWRGRPAKPKVEYQGRVSRVIGTLA